MLWTLRLSGLVLVLTFALTEAASKNDWKSRSIYQIVTDRFARSDNSSTFCDSTKGLYCGGNFQGIIQKLDYIQDLGFSAVRPRLCANPILVRLS